MLKVTFSVDKVTFSVASVESVTFSVGEKVTFSVESDI